MKKICIFLLSSFIVCFLTSACQIQQDSSMVKSQRRFAKYMEPQQDKNSGMIDLSEGPRIKYDAYLGPQNLNFDFKIVNPY